MQPSEVREYELDIRNHRTARNCSNKPSRDSAIPKYSKQHMTITRNRNRSHSTQKLKIYRKVRLLNLNRTLIGLVERKKTTCRSALSHQRARGSCLNRWCIVSLMYFRSASTIYIYVCTYVYSPAEGLNLHLKISTCINLCIDRIRLVRYTVLGTLVPMTFDRIGYLRIQCA